MASIFVFKYVHVHELGHEKRCVGVNTNSKDPDQPAAIYTCSLIRSLAIFCYVLRYSMVLYKSTVKVLIRLLRCTG